MKRLALIVALIVVIYIWSRRSEETISDEPLTQPERYRITGIKCAMPLPLQDSYTTDQIDQLVNWFGGDDADHS